MGCCLETVSIPRESDDDYLGVVEAGQEMHMRPRPTQQIPEHSMRRFDNRRASEEDDITSGQVLALVECNPDKRFHRENTQSEWRSASFRQTHSLRAYETLRLYKSAAHSSLKSLLLEGTMYSLSKINTMYRTRVGLLRDVET